MTGTYRREILGPEVIKHCDRCAIAYDWRRSTACLKMTYCGFMCESNALGFDLDRCTRGKKAA